MRHHKILSSIVFLGIAFFVRAGIGRGRPECRDILGQNLELGQRLLIPPGSRYPKLARPGKLCNSQPEKSWIDPVKKAIPVATRSTPITRSIAPK